MGLGKGMGGIKGRRGEGIIDVNDINDVCSYMKSSKNNFK